MRGIVIARSSFRSHFLSGLHMVPEVRSEFALNPLFVSKLELIVNRRRPFYEMQESSHSVSAQTSVGSVDCGLTSSL